MAAVQTGERPAPLNLCNGDDNDAALRMLTPKSFVLERQRCEIDQMVDDVCAQEADWTPSPSPKFAHVESSASKKRMSDTFANLKLVADKLELFENSQGETLCADHPVEHEGTLWKRSKRVTYVPRLAAARRSISGSQIRYTKTEPKAELRASMSPHQWSPWMTICAARVVSEERYEFQLGVTTDDRSEHELNFRAETRLEFDAWMDFAPARGG